LLARPAILASIRYASLSRKRLAAAAASVISTTFNRDKQR